MNIYKFVSEGDQNTRTTYVVAFSWEAAITLWRENFDEIHGGHNAEIISSELTSSRSMVLIQLSGGAAAGEGK